MILYNDNGLKIIISIMNIDENIIADKDVPSGLYYKIIQNFHLPIEPIETRTKITLVKFKNTR
jgi:hypothetical protein